MNRVNTTKLIKQFGTILPVFVASSILIWSKSSQAQNVPPPYNQQQLNIVSGVHNGDSKDYHVAFSQKFDAGSAPWVQIHFGEVSLGTRSYVRLTSGENGDQQTLDAEMMQHWNNNSGIFRGGSVLIELIVAANDSNISIEINGATVGENFAPIESLCDGDDDRLPSSDSRIGRLFFGGCTAWLVSNGAVLTAGHCFPVGGGVVEFNVPQSQANGNIVPAALQDQYPIDGAYAAFWNDGPGQIGRDWGVFSIGPNSQTGFRAHRIQGFIRCTNALPAVDTTLRLTGFGVDDTPLSLNFTQQTDTGPFFGEGSDSDGIWLEHRVDTLGANSGSPLLWNSQDVAIGIHTTAGCNTDDDSTNSGTSFELNELESFMNMFWGTNVEQVDRFHPPLQTSNGSILRPWATVSSGVNALGTGGVLTIVQGSYDETLTISKAMTIQAPVGTVTIGE